MTDVAGFIVNLPQSLSLSHSPSFSAFLSLSLNLLPLSLFLFLFILVLVSLHLYVYLSSTSPTFQSYDIYQPYINFLHTSLPPRQLYNTYLSIFQSITLTYVIHPSICLLYISLIILSFNIYNHQSSINVSPHPSIFLSTYRSISPSIYLSICPCIYLPLPLPRAPTPCNNGRFSLPLPNQEVGFRCLYRAQYKFNLTNQV